MKCSAYHWTSMKLHIDSQWTNQVGLLSVHTKSYIIDNHQFWNVDEQLCLINKMQLILVFCICRLRHVKAVRAWYKRFYISCAEGSVDDLQLQGPKFNPDLGFLSVCPFSHMLDGFLLGVKQSSDWNKCIKLKGIFFLLIINWLYINNYQKGN